MTSKLDKYNLTKKWDSYSLKKEWAKRATKRFEKWTKKIDAIKWSAKIVKKTEGSLKIHKNSWWYQEERTYPKKRDPKSSKG